MRLFKPADKGGFTLLEVLLAVLLVGVVLGAVYGTFNLVERAKEGSSESLLRLYEARKTMDTMRREIEAMQGPFEVADREFYGKQGSSISFTGFSPQWGVFSKVAYSIVDEGGKLDLQKEFQLPGQAKPRTAILLENVEAFTVEVYTGGKWVKTLQSGGSGSPVRITMKIPFKGSFLTLTETAQSRREY